MLDEMSSIYKHDEVLDIDLVVTFIKEIPNMDFKEYSEQLDIDVELLHDVMWSLHESREGTVINTDSRCKDYCVDCLFDSHVNFKFKLDPKFDLDSFTMVT